MSSAPELTSRIVGQERMLVAASVAVLTAIGWWHIAAGASFGGSTAMPAMQPPALGALVVMWWLMMVAMMLPSAAPAILLYARVRNTRSRDAVIAQTWVFLAGYLIVWLLFSIAAALVQHVLARPSLANDRLAQAAVLVVAGLYQLSPVKALCVNKCRAPAQFISRYWRPGWHGAVQLGLRHGAYCVGCCWLLMALLFVGGVMNLLWVVALTLIVAIEKLVPKGDWFGRFAGVALIAWGGFRLLA